MQTVSRRPPAGFVPQAESQGFRARALSTGPHCHPPKKTIHSKQLTTSFGFSPDENTWKVWCGTKGSKGTYSNNKASYNEFQIGSKRLQIAGCGLPTNYLSIARNLFRSSSSWAWTFSALAFWVRNTSLSCCRFAMRSSTICRQFSSAWMKMIYTVDSPSFTLIRPTDHLSVKKPTQWFWDKPSFCVVRGPLSHSVGPTLALRLLEIGDSYLSLSFILDSFPSLMPSDFCSYCPMKTFLLLGPLTWQPDNCPHVLFPAWWGFWLYLHNPCDHAFQSPTLASLLRTVLGPARESQALTVSIHFQKQAWAPPTLCAPLTCQRSLLRCHTGSSSSAGLECSPSYSLLYPPITPTRTQESSLASLLGLGSHFNIQEFMKLLIWLPVFPKSALHTFCPQEDTSGARPVFTQRRKSSSQWQGASAACS